MALDNFKNVCIAEKKTVCITQLRKWIARNRKENVFIPGNDRQYRSLPGDFPVFEEPSMLGEDGGSGSLGNSRPFQITYMRATVEERAV